MHAGLVGQASPGVVALDEIRGLIESTVVGFTLFDDFELPTAKCGVASIHLGQVTGEEIGLLASLGAADLEDHVASLVGVARQQQRLEHLFEAGYTRLGGVDLLTPQFAVVSAGLIEHLSCRGEVVLGRLEFVPGDVDLREFLKAT